MRRLALTIVLLAATAPVATAAVQLPTAPAPYALGDRDVRSLVRLSPTTFIAGTDGGIFLSRNTARSFRRRYAGSVDALTKDAKSARTVYAAIGGRIVRSTNAGLTWKVMRKLRATGPQPALTSLAVSGSTLVAGSDLAVYVSRNTGRTWRRRPVGSPVSNVAIQPGTGLIWLAGREAGVGFWSRSGNLSFVNAGLPATIVGGVSRINVAGITFPGGPGNPIFVSVCGNFYSVDNADLGGMPWRERQGVRQGTNPSCDPVTPGLAGPLLLAGNRRDWGYCSDASGCSPLGEIRSGTVRAMVRRTSATSRRAATVLIGTSAGLVRVNLPRGLR